MPERWSETPGVLPRLAVIVLAVAAIGLPINNLYSYTLFAGSAFVLLRCRVSAEPRRWLAAMGLALLVVAQHALMPAPRIEEGHNVFLIDGPGNALEKGLPAGAYRAMAERFDAAYPPERRCRSGELYCWRPGSVPDRAFAFAADGALDRPMYSRRVTGVDFDNPVWLRLGFVNDGSLDLHDKGDGVTRLLRDRRSLAIFGRWQIKLPYFVMYRFPADIVGSRLCWRGAVLWEDANGQFEQLESKDRTCRELRAEDIGQRIFGLSIGPDASLAMKLKANWTVVLRRALDASTAGLGVLGILLLLVRWHPRRAVLPAILAGSALLLVVVIDATMVGGYRALDAGDDGLIYSGFARAVLQSAIQGHVADALKGVEPIYFFTPGMRYFRALEFAVFGDTFFAYLTVMLALPLIVHAAIKRLVGRSWATAFTLGFVLTPAGALFGSSYFHYVSWASRGFADPLAATAFLAAIAALSRANAKLDLNPGDAFASALLMAMAVLCRPNLAPGVAVILGGIGLIMLARQQFRPLAALCLGFAPVLTSPWHNWHFGHSLVPFTTTMTGSLNYVMPPLAYWEALWELLRLQSDGAHVRRAMHQIAALLSGPSEKPFAIPIHALALVLTLRVAACNRYNPLLRLIAAATLALAVVGFIYVVFPRYHFLMWLLAAIAAVAWLKLEGLELVARYRPHWRDRLSNSHQALRLSRGLAWLNERS